MTVNRPRTNNTAPRSSFYSPSPQRGGGNIKKKP